MAEAGYQIVGLHAPGTPLEDVKDAVTEESLSYPTLLPRGEHGAAKIGDFPAGVYPYAILVGPNGKVVAHGALDDEDANLLGTLRELDR